MSKMKTKKIAPGVKLVPMDSKKGTEIIKHSFKKGEIGVMEPQIRFVKSKAKKKEIPEAKRRIAWSKVKKMQCLFAKREKWLEEEVERQQSRNRFLEQKIEAIIGKIKNETERADLYLKQSSRVIVEMEAVKKTTDQNNRITTKLLNYIDHLESDDCRSEIL